MRPGEKESVSVWQEAKRRGLTFSQLEKNINVDVCVVGAGIAGVTTAYMLAQEGKSVAVVEAWSLASGETGRTTAHVTAVLDDRFYVLETLFGEKGAKLAADSHKSAMQRIEKIAKEERIDCDFEHVPGFLVALDGKQKEALDKEAKAVRHAGFTTREILTRVPISGVKIKHNILFPAQITFNMAKYITGLAAALQRIGGKIYVGTHVNEIKGGENAYVKTDDGFKIKAKHIVVATHTPLNDHGKISPKQTAYVTYVIGYQVPKDSYKSFLLWDLDEPYHYVRIMHEEGNDILLVGGEDHREGQTPDVAERYKKLDAWTKKYFAKLGPIKYRWSGKIMETDDYLAFIGRNPSDKENVYIITGDSGNGITYGTIAGMLISDLIAGRPNPWKKLYDPARKPLKNAATEVGDHVMKGMTKAWAIIEEKKLLVY